MHTSRPMIVLILSVLACGAPGLALAAGSGGGGASSPSYEPARRATPEEASMKLFKSGIRHRDRALKQEDRAADASSEKKRDKALAKAAKEWGRAVDKQGEALRVDPRNYKAANELGYALRKTGDFRKAIGAYNYALEINPNFHEAIEYRGEAFLALGLLEQSKQAYMTLFRNDRPLADQLMAAFESWASGKAEALSASEADFAAWVEERKRLARITDDLSMNNTRNWSG